MPKAVVLGGNGLIGSATLRALKRAGFDTVGVGRAAPATPRPGWITQDITSATPADWQQLLAGADVVVNAAGALQDGAQDRLQAIHVDAVATLVAALEGTKTRLIQISAAGVSETASTAFFRTKAKGDARVQASALDWVILRPTLVFGADAYGGTALLRAIAATPLIEPRVFADAPIQTVWVEDLAAAIVDAAQGKIPGGTVADITEAESRSFAETVRQTRAWLGFRPWHRALTVPKGLLIAMARIADGLGQLGWRVPLRTNALRALADGITGDPGPWHEAGGRPARPFTETLAEIVPSHQERWFAGLYLLLPLVVGVLAVFWIASGVIAMAEQDAAQAVLRTRGIGAGLATAIVVGGALADIALGAAILVRRTAQTAALGMAGLAGLYLVGGTAVAPDLWADPLGPYVKVLPALVLALVAAVLLGRR